MVVSPKRECLDSIFSLSLIITTKKLPFQNHSKFSKNALQLLLFLYTVRILFLIAMNEYGVS